MQCMGASVVHEGPFGICVFTDGEVQKSTRAFSLKLAAGFFGTEQFIPSWENLRRTHVFAPPCIFFINLQF